MTEKTAAELITARANPSDPHFGLLTCRGEKVCKADQQDEADLKALETKITRRPKP